MATRFPGTEENPTQGDYDDLFNRKGQNELQQWENMRDTHPDAVDARQSLDSNDGKDGEDIKSQESNPAPWSNKTEPQEPKPEGKQGIKGFFQVHKKKGPVGVILTLLIGGAVGVSFLSPGLLMLHVTETITDALNRQFPSMEIRTSKVLTKKISNQALSGMCTKIGNVRCKYHSLNDRQLELLRKAGLTVNVESSTIRGRHQVTSIEFEGRTIDPTKLVEEMQNDARLRSAFKSAYNSKFAGFADKVFNRVSQRLGFTKVPPTLGMATDEERTKAHRDYANTRPSTSTDDIDRSLFKKGDDGLWRDDYGNTIDNDGTAAIRNAEIEAARSVVNDLGEGIGSITNEGKKASSGLFAAANDAIRSADTTNFRMLAGAATGVLLAAPDAACNIYGLYRAVSFGAKTIRSEQMARYAMSYLSVSSMIRAGDASPEDVAYYANILTKTVNEEVVGANGEKTIVTSKAATDSYGYKHIAHGDTGPLTPSASEFVAGGDLGGEMTGVATAVLSKVGGQEGAKHFCGIIKNPWVQTGIVVTSLALVVFTGPLGAGTLTALAGSAAIGVAASSAFSVAQSMLTPVLADMAAGILIDDTVFGEKAGDALVAGSGVIMSTAAGMGGNAPLKPEQAVAYMNTQQNVLAQYAEEERLARSPLDPTSPHTFMGKIVGQLVPYSTQTSTLSSFAATSLSITKRSIASIFTPSAFAATNTIETYSRCDDMDYRELNVATDAFCNPIRGIPAKYLDVDPVAVLDYLNGSLGERTIDEDTGMPDTKTGNGKLYAEFIQNCINRERPLGDSGENFDLNDGKECFIEDSDGITAQTKAYWYIYHIDQRVLDGMENGYEISGVSCGPGSGSGGGGIDEPTADAINARIALSESANGWEEGTSPLSGTGQAFLDLGRKYGVNAGVAVAILQRESQLGTDRSVLPTNLNNFGGNTAAPGSVEGTCGYEHINGRDWKKFCTAEEGLEGLFQNLDSAVYRDTDGTVSAVLEVYAPSYENDVNDMWNIFRAVADDLDITIEENTPVFTTGSGGGSDCRTATGGGAGLSAIWGGEGDPAKSAFGVDSSNGLYDYGIDYGLNGLAHTGIDIMLDPEAPLYSPVSGTVTCEGTNKGPGSRNRGCLAFNDYLGQGNGHIQIELDNGDVLILGHTSTSLVKVGDRVRPGQQVGTNGGMYSWHVHVEYRVVDETKSAGYAIVDPEKYLGGVRG